MNSTKKGFDSPALRLSIKVSKLWIKLIMWAIGKIKPRKKNDVKVWRKWDW